MNLKLRSVIRIFLSGLLVPGLVLAADIGSPQPDVIEGLYPGRAYSPYAQRSLPSRVYWGDTHLHT